MTAARQELLLTALLWVCKTRHYFLLWKSWKCTAGYEARPALIDLCRCYKTQDKIAGNVLVSIKLTLENTGRPKERLHLRYDG